MTTVYRYEGQAWKAYTIIGLVIAAPIFAGFGCWRVILLRKEKHVPGGTALATEVAKFREWAIIRKSPDYPGRISHGVGEWECDYPNWQSLYAAVGDTLAVTARGTVADGELELLLYVLARDNEDEYVLKMLEQFPGIAMQVVEVAVSFPEVDARWQAAVLAGRIGAAAIVRRFLNDEVEYVRRRAGFAFQEMESRE